LLIAIADNLPRRPKPVLARSNDEEEGEHKLINGPATARKPASP